jgi:hypothetical protein
VSELNMQTVEQFWTWFAYYAPTIEFPPDPAMMDQIGNALAAIDPQLGFQIGQRDDEMVIEISGEGRKRMIPIVVDVVAAAPDIAGWRVKAFRQPCDIGGVSVGNGRYYSTDNVQFALKRDHAGTHVALFLDGFATAPNEVGPIAFMLLDATLGELSVMTEIQGLNFFDTRQASIATRPLRELPAALEN